MKPFIAVMLFVVLQEMVDTSFSDEEKGNIQSADRNEELLSRNDRGSDESCGKEQCKVLFHLEGERITASCKKNSTVFRRNRTSVCALQ